MSNTCHAIWFDIMLIISSQAILSQVHIISCHFMSHQVHVMSCHVILVDFILCHVEYTLCHGMSRTCHSFHVLSSTCYINASTCHSLLCHVKYMSWHAKHMNTDKSHYLKMNDPLSSNSFLSVLNRDITLFMNLWKYLLSCLCGTEVCSDEVGELDSDILCEGLFLGGPAGEAEISASASRTRRTTCKKEITAKLQSETQWSKHCTSSCHIYCW